MKQICAALAATLVLAGIAGCSPSDKSSDAGNGASSTATSTSAPAADTTAAAAPPDATPPPAAAGVPKVKIVGKPIKTSDGLVIENTKIGTGPSPKTGQTVTVNYVGMLTDGTIFDASANHGGTFDFVIGQGQVIKGWDEGVMGMKVGGSRRLIIPASLGYGDAGAGQIPPNATLVFDIDLKNVQ